MYSNGYSLKSTIGENNIRLCVQKPNLLKNMCWEKIINTKVKSTNGSSSLEGLIRMIALDCTLAKKKLKWKAEKDLKTGISETVKFFIEQRK